MGGRALAGAVLGLVVLQACAETSAELRGQPGPNVQDRGGAGGEGQPSLAMRFVEIGNVRLRYAERGTSGPPVVLLHGNGSMLEDFVTSGVLERVAVGRRVLVFDRPGFGESERPRDRNWTPEAQAALFADAFARLGIERPVVVGHSWGALVALALALNHPDRVSGLVLVSGYYFPVPRPAAVLGALPAVPVLGDVLRYTVWPLFGALLEPSLTAAAFDPAPVPARFLAGFRFARTLRPEQTRAAAEESGFLMASAAALERRYCELRLPVAIVAGAEDRLVEVGRQSVRLHGEVPGSRLRVVPAEGHMVHHGAAGVVADEIEIVAAGQRER